MTIGPEGVLVIFFFQFGFATSTETLLLCRYAKGGQVRASDNDIVVIFYFHLASYCCCAFVY